MQCYLCRRYSKADFLIVLLPEQHEKCSSVNPKEGLKIWYFGVLETSGMLLCGTRGTNKAVGSHSKQTIKGLGVAFPYITMHSGPV